MADRVSLRQSKEGRFQSVARSGQESLAQGLPWEILPTRLALKLKGLPGARESAPMNLWPDCARISSPFSFRVKRLFSPNPG
jgi:hypothetical protein